MRSFLASRAGFWTILSLFGVQALWIALTARYPMAFDENFHYGVIRLHTETIFPFFKTVSEDTSMFGAIARDPSFLYHYLFSFPYRLIALATDSLAAQVIALRVMNIGLVLAGLITFRRLLTRLGTSPLRSNLIMLFFSLIPIFPLMAAQISYDNLIFLLAGLVLLLGVTFLQKYHQDNIIDAGVLSRLLLLCLFASMVKYAFLPVFAATLLCVAVVLVRQRQRATRSYKVWWLGLNNKFRLAYISGLLIGLALFVGSYGLNIVSYGTPIPRCDTVLSETACTSYAPWYRDYLTSQTHAGTPLSAVPAYGYDWLLQMMHETFFTIYSRFDGMTSTVMYFTGNPLPVMYVTAWILFIVGTLFMLANLRFIWRNPAYRLIMIVLMTYCAALFYRNLTAYLRTGTPVAIHGRYVIPLLLPVVAIAVACASRSLARIPRRFLPTARQRLLIMGLLLLLWLQGGGLVSYVIGSNDDWLWQQSRPAITANRVLRAVMWPVIFKSDDNY